MRAFWLCAGLSLALAPPARADEPKKADLKTYQVPYRFTARPWDIERVESTCTSCAVGCRVAI